MRKYDDYTAYLTPSQRRLYEAGVLSDDDIYPLVSRAVEEFRSRPNTAPTVEGIAAGPPTMQEARDESSIRAYHEDTPTSTAGAAGRGLLEGLKTAGRGMRSSMVDQVLPQNPSLMDYASEAADPVRLGSMLGGELSQAIYGEGAIEKVRQQELYEREIDKAQQQGRMGRIDDASDAAGDLGKAFIKYAPAVGQAAPLAAAILARNKTLAKATAAGLAAQGFGQEYDEAPDTMSVTEKMKRAQMGAAIEYGTERLGPLAGDATKAFKAFALNALGEVGQEVVGQVGRDVRDLAIAPDLAPQSLEEFGTGLKETAIGAALAGGAVSAVGARGNAKAEANRRRSALRTALADLDASGDVDPVAVAGAVEAEEMFKRELSARQGDLFGGEDKTRIEDMFSGELSLPKNSLDETAPTEASTITQTDPRQPQLSEEFAQQPLFQPEQMKDAGKPTYDPNADLIAKERAKFTKAQEKKAKAEEVKTRNLTSKRVQEYLKTNPKATDKELGDVIKGTVSKPQAVEAVEPTPSKVDRKKIRQEGVFSIATPVKEGLARDEAIEQLVYDDSKLGKAARDAITSKKVNLVNDESALPEEARGRNAGGYFDGKQVYVVADKLDKDSLIPTMIHEVKHYYDTAADTSASPRSFKNVVGEKANTALIGKIKGLAGKNKVADAALARYAKINDTTGKDQDEIVTYFAEEAAKAKKSGGVLGSATNVANDLIAATRKFYVDKTGKDIDVTVNDLDYMSRKLFENVSKSKVKDAAVTASKFSTNNPDETGLEVEELPFDESLFPSKDSYINNNASGESEASLEAINRVQEEKDLGRTRVLIDRDGTTRELSGVQAVDTFAGPGQVIVQRGVGKNEWTVISSDPKVSNELIEGKINASKNQLDAFSNKATGASKGKFSVAADDISYAGSRRFGVKDPLAARISFGQGKSVVVHPDSNAAKTQKLFSETFRSKLPKDIEISRDQQYGAVRESELKALTMLNRVNEELAKIPNQKEVRKMLEAYDRAPDRPARIAAFNKMKAKYPVAAKAFNDAREQIFNNSEEIIDLLSRDPSKMSDKDRAVVAKIEEQLGNYITRTYDIFGPDKQRNAHMEFLTTTDEGQRRVLEAKAWVQKHVAAIPSNLKRTHRDHLEALYDMWVPGDLKTRRDTSELSTDDLREVLEKVRDVAKGEKLLQATDKIMEDLMAVGYRSKQIGKAAQMFRGARNDLTIVSARKDVPEEIRALWGEQTDPVMNAFTTLTKQGEFIARMKEQWKLLDDFDGKYFFDREIDGPNNVTLHKLEGESWGPLQGKFTTQEVKDYLDLRRQAGATWSEFIDAAQTAMITKKVGPAFAELGKFAFGKMAWAGGKIKWASVVANPMNFIYNFAGSPLQLISNGNFKFKGVPKAFDTAFKKLPGAAYGTVADEDVAELIRNNIQDSAFIGELKDAEFKAVVRKFTGPKGSGSIASRVKDSVGRAASYGTDIYAAADLYAKIANYYREKEFVTDFYKALGSKKSPEDIERITSERVQQTNFSFNRAWGPAKFFEQGGITNFLTYNAEVFRTIAGNLRLGVRDIATARNMQNKEAAALLMKHGQARLAGATAASAGSTMLFKSMASIIGWAIGAPEEDEKEKMIKEFGLPDIYKDSVPMLVGADGVNRDYFDVGRLDPYGPLNELVRSVMSGDEKEMANAAGSLFILNAALDLSLQATGLKDQKNPRLKQNEEEVYKALEEQALAAGMSKDQFDLSLRTMETLIPRVMTTVPLAILSGNENESTGRRVFEAMGMNVIEYRPERDLGKTAQFQYTQPVNEARQEWSNFVASQKSLTKDQVKENFIDIKSVELDAWQTMNEKVQAAEAAGLSRRQLTTLLKEANLNALQIASLVRDKFTPTAVSLDKLDGDKQEELKDAKSSEERRQINKKYRFLRGEVIKLNKNHKELLED